MSEKFTGVQHSITAHVCKSPSDAIREGHFYRPPVFLPARIDKLVAVDGGTKSGKQTLDIVFVTEQGQKYVVMTTRALLEDFMERSKP